MTAPGRHAYPWPRVAHTADVALLKPGDVTRILLIRRARAPFAGFFALPGGFVDPGEDAATAARRELAEETGVTATALEPLMTLDRPGRDPRGRTVTQVFLGVADDAEPAAADDAAEAGWFPLSDPPPLAFDHDICLARLRALIDTGGAHPPLARLLTLVTRPR